MQILNFTCNCRRLICEHWTGTNKITWRLISCSQRKTRALIIWLMKLTTYLNIKKYKFHVNSFWCKNTSIQNGIARRNVKMYDIFIRPWLSYLRFYKKALMLWNQNIIIHLESLECHTSNRRSWDIEETKTIIWINEIYWYSYLKWNEIFSITENWRSSTIP